MFKGCYADALNNDYTARRLEEFRLYKVFALIGLIRKIDENIPSDFVYSYLWENDLSGLGRELCKSIALRMLSEESTLMDLNIAIDGEMQAGFRKQIFNLLRTILINEVFYPVDEEGKPIVDVTEKGVYPAELVRIWRASKLLLPKVESVGNGWYYDAKGIGDAIQTIEPDIDGVYLRVTNSRFFMPQYNPDYKIPMCASTREMAEIIKSIENMLKRQFGIGMGHEVYEHIPNKETTDAIANLMTMYVLVDNARWSLPYIERLEILDNYLSKNRGDVDNGDHKLFRPVRFSVDCHYVSDKIVSKSVLKALTDDLIHLSPQAALSACQHIYGVCTKKDKLYDILTSAVDATEPNDENKIHSKFCRCAGDKAYRVIMEKLKEHQPPRPEVAEYVTACVRYSVEVLDAAERRR